MKQKLAHLSLYRWRYVIGYLALGALFALSVIIAGLYAPGGVSQAEIDTIARTNQLASGVFALPDLPFHGLQLAIFSLFGVSIFTIKLPAILFSIISAVAIFFLLRRWFKPNIVVLSMLIMAVTGQFIFLAQHGTPQILYIMYSALILLFASLILQNAKGKRIWMVALGASVALSLYTPYFAYVNLGLFIAAWIHPHPRHYLLKKANRLNWAIADVSALIIAAPLVYFCMRSPELLSALFSLHLTDIDLVGNLTLLLQSYFWIQPIVAHGQIIPTMTLSSLALVIFGIIVVFRHRYAARSYVIAVWLLFTVPILVIYPHLTAIIIVPLFILLTMGIEALLGQWYGLFPENPYARGVGLILTILLVGTMTLTGIDRYMNGYRHLPEAAREFSTDISLLAAELRKRPAKTELIVDAREEPIYQALAQHNGTELIVRTDASGLTTKNVLMSRQAHELAKPQGWQLQRIVTNDRATEADRFYLYKPN